MCRISGFWDFKFKGNYDLSKINADMRDVLFYGGPDDYGSYTELNRGLALGHRRLSILDLSALGHQPMEFEDLVITYNGEIYNFIEIRGELERYGYTFSSHSDTEVILKAFHRWNFNCLDKFRGMWAFAIWDKREKKLMLCRDRVGVKPLYWYHKDGLFMFASELKAFHRHPGFHKELDTEALSLYLQYGYITSPYSIFRHTYKLEPGHYLKVDKSGNVIKEKYWDVKDYFIKGHHEKHEWLKRDEEDIAGELEGILTEAFKLRMIADVPVGMFLSGGIDSSLLTALLQKDNVKPIKTFTVGFYEKEFNEAEWAKKIANHLGTEHEEMYCTLKEAFEIIYELPELYDEPFGDSSAIPTHLVSKLAKKKVKVSLSADGGDEQFCGYTKYWVVGNKIKKLNGIPFYKLFSQILDLMSPNDAAALYDRFKFFLPKWTNFKDKYIKFRNVLSTQDQKSQIDLAAKFFMPDELLSLGLKDFRDQTYKLDNIQIDLIAKMMLFDIKTYMVDDIMTKVDRATMGVSLEGREPFLDNKIVEYSAQLPIDLKYKNNTSKYILKKILYKYIPRELIERPKQGFGVPIYAWFEKELHQLLTEYLDYERIKREGIFNPDAVKSLLEAYLKNSGVSAHKLWFLLTFQMWKGKWV